MKLTYAELHDLRKALITAVEVAEGSGKDNDAVEYRYLQQKVEDTIKSVDLARKLSSK